MLDVGDKSFRLHDADISEASRLITGKADCHLPIVYISAPFQGGCGINVDSLANELSGMAHVVVEPNRPFSIRLKAEVNSQNVYGGTIGVYWPDGGGRRSFFAGPDFDDLRDMEKAVVEEIRAALINRRSLLRCTWSAVQEAVSRKEFTALKAAGSEEVEKYIEIFDSDMQAKEQRLIDAENEINRLRRENQVLECRNPMRSNVDSSAGFGINLKAGSEQDLYSGELYGVVYEAICEAKNRATEDSRRCHILSSLQSNNKPEKTNSKREELKSLLRGYSKMDAKPREDSLTWDLKLLKTASTIN